MSRNTFNRYLAFRKFPCLHPLCTGVPPTPTNTTLRFFSLTPTPPPSYLSPVDAPVNSEILIKIINLKNLEEN
jgi:hypothetical protein